MPLKFTQHATPLDSDLETPVGLFIRLVGENPGILLESAETDGRWGRYSIIATDFVISASCQAGLLKLEMAENEQLVPLRDLQKMPFVAGLRQLINAIEVIAPDTRETYAPITRALYGYLGYGVAGLLEPKLANILPAEEAQASLVLPGTIILFDHRYNKITKLCLQIGGQTLKPPPPHSPRPVTNPSSTAPAPGLSNKDAYMAAVKAVKDEIRQGEAIQVVLSTPFTAPLADTPFNLYRRLRRLNPSPYLFYMNLFSETGTTLLGSSPEVLISCANNRLQLCPIAGTRPRSHNPVEDVLFGDELLQDPKEKAEHIMLVDLGRNDLGRIAKAGSVKLQRFMEVERFSHVMHLTSRIEAELSPGLDAIDILSASFPAGTVSGAPKIRAMEIIAEKEKRPRGLYAGAIGWLGLDKDAVHLDMGITIRSLWTQGNQVSWQAGAGIVYDSVPETEWDECRAKAAIIKKIVEGEAPAA